MNKKIQKLFNKYGKKSVNDVYKEYIHNYLNSVDDEFPSPELILIIIEAKLTLLNYDL